MRFARRRRPTLCLALLLLARPSPAGDVALVPLWDGETWDPAPSGALLNRFGGNPVAGSHATVSHTTAVVHSGSGAFRIGTNGVIPPGGFDFVATAFTGFGPSPDYVDARNLARFSEALFWVMNDTGSALTLRLEIKDDRLDNAHRARRAWVLDGSTAWRRLSAPLSLEAPWVVDGSPDLTRARQFAFIIEADQGAAVDGSLFLDDLALREPGGPVDPDTAPAAVLVERIARRQFEALWGARDRQSGLLPAVSIYVDLMGTNVLAALLQMLPTGVALGWVPGADADAWVAHVVSTLGGVMDGSNFVPPRYLDRVTLAGAGTVPEESSVDAAFLYLALYQYQTLPGTGSVLAASIAGLLARFDLAAFAAGGGWRMAYRYGPTPGFTPQIYDGYSGEPWLISLAAHLSTTHGVPIATHYHSGVNRVRDQLVDPARAHLVHSSAAFRAPFLQWLFSLFVKVDDRGRDTYPLPSLASNPFTNAVLYQREAHAWAAAHGRGSRLQPDAGDDGYGVYEQYSYYDDFSRPNLFMPWSVAFSFLAEPTVAEAALRSHLSHGLHGPLGLADSADWPAGASAPTRVRAGSDFWNLSLSTLALLQYLYGGNERLAREPAVRAALDQVLPPLPGLDFQTVVPCRLVDTRDPPGAFGGPPLIAGESRLFAPGGRCGIPATARAVSLNVTVTGATAPGNLRLYPGLLAVPMISTINYVPGLNRANNAVTALNELGELAVFCSQASGTVHLVLDVNGYFSEP